MVFESFEAAVAASKELNPFLNEGFVLCDKKFFRVKIKSPEYVALTYLGFNNGNSWKKFCVEVKGSIFLEWHVLKLKK
jgi:hypothetical protein